LKVPSRQPSGATAGVKGSRHQAVAAAIGSVEFAK